jgi:hypothetical protein
LSAASEPVHAAVQGGGEEQPLTPCGRTVHDPGDRWQEAQVRHVIGLVKDRHVHVRQGARTPVKQVDQPAGRRDHDVGATAEAIDLAADGHAAVDRSDQQSEAAAQRLEHLGHLLGQLAGGYQDQSAGRGFPRTAADGGDPAEHGQAEGQGLARPGLGPAEYIAAGQRVWQGAGLDRERHGDVLRGEGAHEPRVYPELAERGGRGLRQPGRGGQGQVELRPGLRPRRPRRCPGTGTAALVAAVVCGRASAPVGVWHVSAGSIA